MRIPKKTISSWTLLFVALTAGTAATEEEIQDTSNLSYITPPEVQWNEPDNQPIWLDMDEAIALGVTQSYELKAVEYRGRAARELIREKERPLLPAVGISLERSRTIVDGTTANQSGSISSTFSDVLSNELRLNTEYVVYDGGIRRMERDSARIEANLFREDYRAAEGRLRLEIQKAYLDVIASRGKIQLGERSLERAREQLRLARLEKESGFLTEANVLAVAARVREIELRLRKARNAHDQALDLLKARLTLDYDMDISTKDDLFFDFIINPPPVQYKPLISRARSNRPEYVRSQAKVYKLKREHEIARNYWIPKLSLGAYVGRRGEYFPLREDVWGVSFKVTFPIGNSTSTTNSGAGVQRDGASRTGTTSSNLQLFDNYSHNRVIMETGAALANALAEHQQLENQLAREVKTVHDELQEAYDSIRLGNGQVYFLNTGIHIMTTRYEAGAVRRLEIMQAEVDLAEAQENLTDALASYVLASHKLEYAAAMEPGSLRLTKRMHNAGNTLPGKLLTGEFLEVEESGPAAPDIRLFLEDPDAEQNRPDEVFEIEKIEIE